MKIFSAIVFLLLLFTGCTTIYNARKGQGYMVIRDPETKILKGTINRAILEADTSFAWFKNNMQYGSVDPDAQMAFTKKAGQFSLLVFSGTWCHDSQNLLPKLYRLLDKSGIQDNRITLIGVDRNKKTLKNLQTKWAITNIPTFIVLKGNIEVGRVVEYGKTGNIEKELGEIVSGM